MTNQSDDKLTLYDAQFESQTEHHGSNVTFNGFGTSIEPGNKIDLIFAKGCRSSSDWSNR